MCVRTPRTLVSNMKYFLYFLLFVLINFGALFIGTIFTGPAVQDTWYVSLHKAPWTPPGFVFGLAWFTIMLCFSFFMANVWKNKQLTSGLSTIYAIHIVVNTAWNAVFFYWHATWPALLLIVALLVMVLWFTRIGFKTSIVQGLLVLPYALWLIIAVSLNAYICFMNP